MSTVTQSTPSFKEAVDQIRDQHLAAVRAGDVEGATDIFAPESVFLPPEHVPLEGIPAIRAWFSGVFSNFRLPDFGLRPAAVEEIGGVMIEHGSWQATFQPKTGGPGPAAGGTYLTVYARLADGSVRVIRDTFNGLPRA